jgi:hypothetical protein
VIGRGHHLNDDRLVECYFAADLGEPVEPDVSQHLGVCAVCRARSLELADFLNGVRADGYDAADEVFTPDKLRVQQDHILRRLEHLNRPARVLSFPSRVTRRISSGARRVTPRWLAAAAAAGLFVGAVGGRMIPAQDRPAGGMHVVGTRSASPRVLPVPAAHAVPVSLIETFDDAAFLNELEAAMDRTHPRELQPFDALTPHVRGIVSQVRSTGKPPAEPGGLNM